MDNFASLVLVQLYASLGRTYSPNANVSPTVDERKLPKGRPLRDRRYRGQAGKRRARSGYRPC